LIEGSNYYSDLGIRESDKMNVVTEPIYTAG